jgi:histidyl-tRNA synthetase
MFVATQPYKGTRDFYPEEMSVRRQIFAKLQEVARQFAFQEYDGPLLEPFDLYAAKSGEELVSQQLYSFEDRGGRKVAIRPEMTPTLARMVAAKVGELSFPLRWFSIPNLYRYERPQKGRLREHWQFNVDILGGENRLADIEILSFVTELFEQFQCKDKVKIRLNHRGWVNFYLTEVLKLNAEKAQRFSKILDAKEKMSSEDFEKALLDLELTKDGRKLFDEYLSLGLQAMFNKYPESPISEVVQILERLEDKNLFEYDPVIMRGLDYYTGIVFEGFDRSLSNRRALFGGGRYDNLIGLFGKTQVSGIGFGLGDVVLMDFLAENALLPTAKASCDFYVTLSDETFISEAQKISKILREKNFSVSMSLKVSAFKAQLKAADRSGARFAILFGEEEWKEKKIILRDLKTSSQKLLTVGEIQNFSFEK